MKRIIFLATVISFFSACQDTAKTDAAQAENEKNLAANRRVFKAIETGERSVLDSLIAGDAVDHASPTGDIRGGDSIKSMLADMHNHFDGLKFDILAEAANGDYLFALSTFKGTVKDDYMGMPAGTKIDDLGVDVIKLKDGKMVEHWGFVDPKEMMEHMQKMPAAAKIDSAHLKAGHTMPKG